MLEGVYVRRIWNEHFDAYSGIGDVADAIPFLLRRIWTPIHLFFIYKVPGEVSRDQLSGHCYSRTLLIQSRRTTCHKTTLHDPLRTAWDLFRTIDETLSMQVPYSAGPHAREYCALFLPPRNRNTKLSILFADQKKISRYRWSSGRRIREREVFQLLLVMRVILIDYSKKRFFKLRMEILLAMPTWSVKLAIY